MADEKETRIDFRPEPEAPVTGSTPELERDPYSSNLFYVEPENIVYDVDAGINAKIEIVSEGENLGTYNIETVDSDQLPSIHFTIMEDVVSGLGPFYLWVESYLVDQEAFTAIGYGPGVGLDVDVTGVIITLGERETNDTGDYYGYFVDYTDASPITFVFPFSHNVAILDNVKIGLTSEAATDPPLYWWESAYRKFEINLDPIFSSKLITVGQLSRLKGSGTASGAQGSDLVTMAQLARLMGKAAPPDNQKGKLVTLSQLKRVQTLKIVSWADGTDEEITAMVAAADAGQIVLSDYWSEGDTRTVSLSSMPATGVGESHAAQSVQFVLTDPGHYTLANGKACSFVVLQKDILSEYGYMNSSVTNSGGWNSCQRRTWCNNIYRNAIPASLRGIFKQFKVRTANGSGSGVTESTDWFSLFSEKEVFGSTTYANSSAESQNTQLNWFKTSSNRIKKNGMNGSARNWWERSPYSGNSSTFCFVTLSGSADWNGANYRYGLAPFGCI